jgi:osmotically-inducible protein OsmY
MKKIGLLAAIGLIAQFGVVQAAYNTYSNNSNSYSNGNTQTTNGNDAKIRKEIQDNLKSGWFSRGYEDVTADVVNGTVTLRGSVDTQDEKQKIEDKVRKVDGVVNVINQINVAPKSSYNNQSNRNYIANHTDTDTKSSLDTAATDADRRINKQIREKLGDGWFTKGYKNIQLNTSNGNVTVTGLVDKDSDVQYITNEIKKIDGVKAVNNQVTVNR